MSNLSIEMTRTIERVCPLAFSGDMEALATATASTADVLGGLFALIRKQAPNEATARQAMKMMVERALRFAESAQTEADGLRAHAAPSPAARQ